MFVAKSGAGLGPFGAGVLCVVLCTCTEPVKRVKLDVSIDADTVVRRSTVRVEATIEAQHDRDRKTWTVVDQWTRTPDPFLDEDWPWSFKLEPADSVYDHYNLVVTARDKNGAVVGHAQALRDFDYARRHGLRVRFDTACFRRAPLCEEGTTCSDNACVDAADVRVGAAADGGVDSAVETPRGPLEGVAQEGAECTDGQRACTDFGTRQPLSCEGGSWRKQTECAPDQRCDTEVELGACLPIDGACANREPNVEYCDGEEMRVCIDLVRSNVRSCAENERCMWMGSAAQCVCRAGYVGLNGTMTGPCVEGSQCKEANGGCDSLTVCSMVGGQPQCSDCPAGYTGSGRQGCTPHLQGLMVDEGALEPAFSRDVREYRVRVPLLVQRVAFTPRLPDRATATLNGAPLDGHGIGRSPLLKLGPTPIELVVTSEFGLSTKYAITIERTAEQQSYIKASNADAGDYFGFWVDLDGDTLLVTAWFEDSSATGVNGDPDDEGATDSGAAYVLVRDGDGWKQQAYLKPNDTSPRDYFGVRAALDGDTVVVGAMHESIYEPPLGASRPGAAYVYTRSNGVWSFQQRLAADPPDGADLFGAGVALDGDTLAVGAPWESSRATRSGAVYIYERSGGTWAPRQVLKSAKPSPDAVFGSVVKLDGDRLLVGAPDYSEPSSRTGSADVFVRRNGTWMHQQFLHPSELGTAANFGFSASIRGDRIAVGAPRTATLPGGRSNVAGEAYVFEFDGTQWNQTQILSAPYPRADDYYGADVLWTSRGLVVGSTGEASAARGFDGDGSRPDAPFSGAVYMYGATERGWELTTSIKPEHNERDDGFGYALAADEKALVVSAPLESSGARGVDGNAASGGNNQSGAIWVFR